MGGEVWRQVAAKLERVIKNRLDQGVGFLPITEAEARRGDMPAAKAYAALVKTPVADGQ